MGTQRPPKLTRMPEVYDRLLDLLRAELELADDSQRLIDGGASTNDYGDWIFFFGYRPNSEEWVSATRTAPAGLAANDIEIITIGVLVAATKTNHDMRAARALVADKIGALERVVTRDQSLGLSGVQATITGHTSMPLHTTNGAEWNQTADIEIKATL